MPGKGCPVRSGIIGFAALVVGGKRVVTEGYDGERGWQQAAGDGKGSPAAADGSAALRHSGQRPTNILRLHEMQAHRHALEYAGREEVERVSYHLVVLTLDDLPRPQGAARRRRLRVRQVGGFDQVSGVGRREFRDSAMFR